MANLASAVGEKLYRPVQGPSVRSCCTWSAWGSSVLYGPIYLKMVFYDPPLMQALGCTNEQLGTLVTVYGIAAVVFYLPSGILLTKCACARCHGIGYAGVAALTLVYALMPSYTVLMGVLWAMPCFPF